MTVEIRPFLAGDVVQLELQPSQRREFGIETERLSMPAGRDFAAYGTAWSAIANGRVVACAGFRETFAPVQAVAWALFDADLPKAAALAATRYARARIADAPYRRIEAIVEAGNARAVGWAKAVGLEPVHLLRNFGLNSEPHILFERVR